METRPVKGHFLSVEGSRGQQSFEPLWSLPLIPLIVQPSSRRWLPSKEPHKQQSPEEFVDDARA